MGLRHLRDPRHGISVQLSLISFLLPAFLVSLLPSLSLPHFPFLFSSFWEQLLFSHDRISILLPLSAGTFYNTDAHLKPHRLLLPGVSHQNAQLLKPRAVDLVSDHLLHMEGFQIPV